MFPVSWQFLLVYEGKGYMAKNPPLLWIGNVSKLMLILKKFQHLFVQCLNHF